MLSVVGTREHVFISKRPRVQRLASFNEQRDPQAKSAVLQYFGKTAVHNKLIVGGLHAPFPRAPLQADHRFLCMLHSLTRLVFR